MAENFKEAGNKAFKARDLEGALKAYGEGLKLAPPGSEICGTLYKNRAATYLKKVWRTVTSRIFYT
jgi:hypothetical protein